MQNYRDADDLIMPWGKCIRMMTIFVMIFTLLFSSIIWSNDYKLCKERTTKCVIESNMIVRYTPLPGERINDIYYANSYIIYPVDYPDMQFAIECWGKNCDDKLILNTELPCYYDGISAPADYCMNYSHDDL